MSFSIELPQTYTFSLCIDQGDRTLVDTTVEVEATTKGIAKAKRTIQRLMNEYAPAIEPTPTQTATPEPGHLSMVVVDESGPAPSSSTWEHLTQRAAGQQNHQLESAPDTPPEKKPEGARGLLRLRCPECGNTFGTFLREYQTEVACKCGHPIDLTGQLGRYHFTCPYCEKETWGKTNLEDPEITVRCRCGGDVELRWEPKAKEYQN